MAPPPKKRRDSQLSKESFDALLARLDPDRDRAAHRYEELRIKLSRYFAGHGCEDPETLAEKTLDRYATRIREGAPIVSETKYLYGIARNLVHEYIRNHALTYNPPPLRNLRELEIENECMRKCGELHGDSYEFLSNYLPLDRQARLKMATQLGISINGLRLRVNRARVVLRKCLRKCMEKALPQN